MIIRKAIPHRRFSRETLGAGFAEAVAALGTGVSVILPSAKELAGLVTDLPADASIDPAIEQQIDQHLGRPMEALNQRDEILAVLR